MFGFHQDKNKSRIQMLSHKIRAWRFGRYVSMGCALLSATLNSLQFLVTASNQQKDLNEGQMKGIEKWRLNDTCPDYPEGFGGVLEPVAAVFLSTPSAFFASYAAYHLISHPSYRIKMSCAASLFVFSGFNLLHYFKNFSGECVQRGEYQGCFGGEYYGPFNASKTYGDISLINEDNLCSGAIISLDAWVPFTITAFPIAMGLLAGFARYKEKHYEAEKAEIEVPSEMTALTTRCRV